MKLFSIFQATFFYYFVATLLQLQTWHFALLDPHPLFMQLSQAIHGQIQHNSQIANDTTLLLFAVCFQEVGNDILVFCRSKQLTLYYLFIFALIECITSETRQSSVMLRKCISWTVFLLQSAQSSLCSIFLWSCVRLG